MKIETNGPKRKAGGNKRSVKRAKGPSKSGFFASVLLLIRRLFRMLLLIVLLGILWIGYMQWEIQSPPNQTLPKSVDVGIVLGASLRKDLPSPSLKERLDHALALYKEQRFTQIIVSGGLDHNGSKLTEAEGMRNYLMKQGVPEKSIWLEPKATSTFENLLYSKQIMDNQGFTTAIVITHDFHGSRSLDIAATVGIQNPFVSTTKSKVLFMPYHDSRETLAYTNWILTKLKFKAGLISSE
jgi:uncharacterized SAM-binding protein YcdF (DUF218 family)